MTFVKRIAGAAALGTVLLFGLSSAQAGYVVTLAQQGSDVVATGNGPINLTGLTFVVSGFSTPQMSPLHGLIITSPQPAQAGDFYTGLFTGPTSFGSGNGAVANSGSGSLTEFDAENSVLGVPKGYISGTSLSNSATYANQTFVSLGVTPGTYVWSWGSGVNQNFTLVIPGSTAVPEPATAALLGTALAGLLLAGAMRRTRQ